MPPDPPDLPRSAVAIRDALPTRMHAEMLFEQAAELLGEAAWVETSGKRAQLRLFRKDRDDAALVAPWPLLELSLSGRLDLVTTLEGVPMDIPTLPGKAPKIHGLGPGQINLHLDGETISVVYGADGRRSELCRPRRPKTFDGAAEALARRTGPPVELLAAWVASLDPVREDRPARLFVPTPFPNGLQSLAEMGRRHLGRALFHDRIPAVEWAAADCLSGDAVAGGATREEALAAWRAEVARARPWLKVEEIPEDMLRRAAEQGFLVHRPPEGDAPMPAPDPAHVPAALTCVLPTVGRAKIGDWRRLAGSRGLAEPHVFCPTDDGWTLYGSAVIARFGPTTARRMIREAEDALGPPPPPPPWPDFAPPLHVAIRTWRLFDENRREIAPEGGDGWSVELHPGDLDSDVVREQVVRLRRVKRDE